MYKSIFFCILLLIVGCCLLVEAGHAAKHHPKNSTLEKNPLLIGDPNEVLPVPTYTDEKTGKTQTCKNGVTVARGKYREWVESFEGEKYTREYAIDFLSKAKIDLDGDGRFSLQECHRIVSDCVGVGNEKYLPEDCNIVFFKCDCFDEFDSRGNILTPAISMNDFQHAIFTCLKDIESVNMAVKYLGKCVEIGDEKNIK